jgi:hypothetical protein
VPVVLYLTKLKEGVNFEKYEKWVREYDYVNVKKNSRTILSYTNHRVNEISRKDSPYDYFEVLEITDIEEYKSEMQEPWASEILKQMGEFVDTNNALIIYTDPL